jgi:hypothetical protein
MIAWIILAHAVGDYLLQTDWMAQEKTKRWPPAIVHGLVYTLPFLLITTSPWALLVIGGTHMVIDRYRLAKHVVWFKNQLQPKQWRPGHTATGMKEETPDWLAYWLLFIQDNIIHILINVLAVMYL